MKVIEYRCVYEDLGIVNRFLDEDLHNDSIREYYWARGFDPRKTIILYYDASLNQFYESDGYNRLDPIFNIHEILEPWKVTLFKKNGECVFTDRTNSFLVELEWIPF